MFSYINAINVFLNTILMVLVLLLVLGHEKKASAPAYDVPSYNFVVSDILIDPVKQEITQIRTAQKYPLQVTWFGKIVNHITEQVYCEGSGISTIELRENDQFGPISISGWVGSECPELTGKMIIADGTWHWTDADGRPRITKFRSNPTQISPSGSNED